MLDILQFIFSDFWIWLGTVILIATIGQSIANIVETITDTITFFLPKKVE